MVDEPFEPQLGRIAASPAGRSRTYLRSILAATKRAGAGPAKRKRIFDCSRVGRGAGAGRLLGATGSLTQCPRRAIVKMRLVRLGSKGIGAARAHLRYIERDGTQRDGSLGTVYSAGADAADGRNFIERCAGDRHQFRLIISAEDGTEYEDLKPLARRFMAQMEKDLGTRLEWVAVDHSDTAHPHSHVILRGRDDRGENLVIAREYICRGMRERLVELVTADLGPLQEFEVRRKLRREITAERFTGIDRALIRAMAIDRSVQPSHRDPFRHALRAGRVKKLEALGLAEPLVGGRWRLKEDFEERLRSLGERSYIIRMMQRDLAANGLERPPADWVVGGKLPQTGLIGRVIARGLQDEISDRHYLLIDGIDGRVHHVGIDAGSAVEPLPENAIVRVSPEMAQIHSADRRIAGIAAANGGRYSADLHLLAEPGASEAYVEAHVRRLGAIRRGGDGIERGADGSWRIASDYIERALAYQQRRLHSAPARVELLSPMPLERLTVWEGATWLDRQLAHEEDCPLRDAGFGREVRAALGLRRIWLLEQQLADELGGEFTLGGEALATLRQRELAATAARFERELGKPFASADEGGSVHGRLARRVNLASGRFALVENSREFALVPWRPLLERHIGREVEGRVRAGGISWRFGRQRSGPAIC